MSSNDQHLSIDQLADLDAEVLSSDDETAVRAHLRTCDECRATSELVAGVPALLASLAPVAVPAEVTARVAAAIEREQGSRSSALDVAKGADAAAARSSRAGVRRRFGARLGAGLLGATAVLGGGYLVVSGMSGGGDDAPSSAGALQESADSASGSDPVGAPSAADADGYTAGSLEADVQSLLTVAPTFGDTQRTPGVTVQGPNGEVGEPDDVATKVCVEATQRKAGSGADAVAVDVSTYDGQRAVVIVLPEVVSGTTSSDAVDVWVVGADCVGMNQSDVDIGRVAANLDVLAHESVPR